MSEPVIDVAAEMRDAPLTGFHIRFAVLIGAILFIDGYDLFNAAYVAPYVRQEWGLGAPQIGMMLSIGLVGLATGALLQGPLADRFGRRATTLGAVWLLGLASLALAIFANSFEVFCAIRLALGVALGMLSPLAFVYINEWAPSRCANRFATLAFVLPFSLGGIAAGLAGLLIAPEWGWRALYLIGGLGIPVALLAHAMLPESVRFLASRERWDQVARILSRARPDRAAAYVGAAFQSGETSSGKGAFASLLAPRYLRTTVSIWVAGALSLLCIHGLTGWLPSIVLAEGAGVRTAFGYGSLLMTMQIFGGLAGDWLADRFERVPVICWGFVGGALSLISLAATLNTPFAMVAVAATGFFIFGAQAVMNNHIAMSYETGLRSTAVGVAVAVNRIGGVAGPMLIGFTQGLPAALWATLGMLAVAQLLAAVTLGVRRPSPPSLRPAPEPSVV
jgi:AAHS family benzoate transporter-like MFS transporter/AAHS family 4-hydroxybenzoate transporter-like MFS transporter